MLSSSLFSSSSKFIEWLDEYYKSFEVLKKMDIALPGATPTECVFSIDKIKLLRFKGEHSITRKTPMLISYALVNRFTVADLQKDKSLIQSLLAQGIDVYIIDWGYPDPADRFNDLDDYINHYVDSCVDFLINSSAAKKIDLLGICQGGAFAICYSALNPNKINKLVTMVTPVNFHTENDALSHMVQEVDLDKFIDAYGNLSGQILNANFNMMQPISLNLKKWLDSVYSLSNEKMAQFFLNMEAWINDSPDQAGSAYKEFITKFYKKNQLYKGELMIGDLAVDAKKITMPVLNVFGSKDHLVPPASSKSLKTIIGSKKYQEIEIDTGHIGMYVSGRAKDVPQKIADWLKG